MKNLFVMTALTLAGSSLAATAPTTLSRGVLKIGMEGTYPPFTYKDEKGNLTGFDVELARAVAAKLGLKPEFVLTEWSGILAGLQANKYDVIVNQVGINPERQKSIGFSAPYAYSSPQIIVKRRAASLQNARRPEGQARGRGPGQQLREAAARGGGHQRGDLSRSAGVPGRSRRRTAGRGLQRPPARRLPDQERGTAGARRGRGRYPRTGGHRPQKTNTGLKAAIDRALLQLKADGTYAKLSRKWFGQDVSKP